MCGGNSTRLVRRGELDAMKQQFVLTIDQGTTSSRAILFDRKSAIRAIAQLPITQYYPASGWVDHDPNEIWRTVRACVAQVITGAGITLADIAAIGITNQRETTIVWDRVTGEPLAPAMVWQSRQSAPYVQALHERGIAERFHQLTGLVPDAYFSATKLASMLDVHPEMHARAEAGDALFGTVDSWLLFKLSGGAVHVTDVTNASRTMLFDIHRLDWSDELLADLAIPRQMLPRVVDSSGWVTDVGLDGLDGTAPITGIAGDQHAALFGQLCFAPGDAKHTIGTGSFLLMNTGDRPVVSGRGLLATVGWKTSARPIYASEGSVFVSGSAVQWLRDGLGIIGSSADIERLLDMETGSGGVVFVPALVGLGAPHWDPTARGSIFASSGERLPASGACHDPRDRVAGNGVGRSHARRNGSANDQTPCGWRRGGQRPVAPAPCRSDRCGGGAPGEPRNDRAGGSLSGRTGNRILGRPG